MKNLNSNNRLRFLSRWVACSRAAGAVIRSSGVKGRHLALVGIIAALSTAAVATVLTPGTGVVSALVFARASFADPTDVRIKVKGQSTEVINVNNAQETVIQQVILAPGGSTGWHSHPGPVIVLIKSGQMSFYDGDDPTCSARIYSAGQSFVDSGQGHVHIARNESTSQNLEIWATYLDVPVGGPFRIDAPNPGTCGF